MPDSQNATTDDHRWMRLAIELAHQCPPAEGAYSVGSVIVDEAGDEISRGYSRDTDSKVHAEESALAKVDPDDPRLATATIYSTLEPCSERASRPKGCAQLILDAGIPRVVIAWREPTLFVADCQGVEMLEQAGVTVVELPELGEAARAVNAHLAIERQQPREKVSQVRGADADATPRRIVQARYAGRHWYAVVLVDGPARYATYEYNAELAVDIVERTRLLDEQRAG